MANKSMFQEKYTKEIIPRLVKRFGYKNAMQAPRLDKIVINMGVGLAAEDIKIAEAAQKDLSTITGQHAVVTRAKKAVSNFKIRKGSAVGCRVTLRRRTMYEFLERLISVALPRVRDFRGINPRGFDHAGNFNFGLTEQTIFPEIETDRVVRPQGMSVSVVIKGAKTKEESYELLSSFGFPFRTRTEKEKAPKVQPPPPPAPGAEG